MESEGELTCEKCRMYLEGTLTPRTKRNFLVQPQTPLYNHVDSFKQSLSGYVYLMWAKGTPRYKVGYSINPTQRAVQLSTGSPYPIVIIHSFATDDMARDEAMIKEAFSPYRVHGEWFELPEAAIELIRLIGKSRD
jgi:hypothetical protein